MWTELEPRNVLNNLYWYIKIMFYLYKLYKVLLEGIPNKQVMVVLSVKWMGVIVEGDLLSVVCMCFWGRWMGTFSISIYLLITNGKVGRLQCENTLKTPPSEFAVNSPITDYAYRCMRTSENLQ